VNAQENRLTVARANGQQVDYDPRRQIGVSVYREQEKKFSMGDRVQFTARSQELKIANRDLGTVESIAQDGTMRLRLDDASSVAFNPQCHPHLDHGYAVTSYPSQGQMADRVLVHVDTELGAKDLLNNRMAYVSISRGQWDAQIFTANREKLPQALGHDVSRQSAHTGTKTAAARDRPGAKTGMESELGDRTGPLTSTEDAIALSPFVWLSSLTLDSQFQ
jgi:ATP-dependent exoDNAse (exonuclease V) alpha subunit